MLISNSKSPCLGVSVGIKDIELICQEKLSGNRYQAISHLSVGFRPEETVNNNCLNSLLNKAEITISLHPVDINLSDIVEIEELDNIKKLADQLEPLYFEEDLGLWRHRNLFLESHLLNPIMSKDAINVTVENVLKCHSLLNIPIAIENPPIYWVDSEIEFWDYFFYIADQADCLIAFDVGHFVGYCRSLDKKIYFPQEQSAVWDKIVTLHLSGMKSWNWNGIPVWMDRHSESFNPQLQSITSYCLKKTRSLYCLLMEMEGASEKVQDENIKIVTNILNH